MIRKMTLTFFLLCCSQANSHDTYIDLTVDNFKEYGFCIHAEKPRPFLIDIYAPKEYDGVTLTEATTETGRLKGESQITDWLIVSTKPQEKNGKLWLYLIYESYDGMATNVIFSYIKKDKSAATRFNLDIDKFIKSAKLKETGADNECNP